jgi:long-chain acyl-CoA synthetase
VREFSVPATFEIAEYDSVVSSVYSHEREDPDHVIFQRQVDGAWTDITCAQAAAQIRSVALGLLANGIEPGDGRAAVGHRYEWPIIDLAILSVGALTVPIYETSSAEQIKHVLNDSGAVWCSPRPPRTRADREARAAQCAPRAAHRGSGRTALEVLAEAGKDVDPALLTAGSRPSGPRSGHPDLHLRHHRSAQGLPAEPVEPAARDPRRQGLLPDQLAKGEKMLVFLPLAHVLARAITIAAFTNKVTLGFTSDIKNLVPTFAVFKPTLVVSVPRVFEKVYNTAEQNAEDGGKGRIFALAADTAIEYSKAQDQGGRACCSSSSTRCSTSWSTASSAPRSAATATPRSPVAPRWVPARALLPRCRADHLRGLRADRDQRRHHRQPGRRHQGRIRRKAVAGQQHAPGRR